MNGTQITIVGNCTRDPELRFTTGGRAVASFGVAVGRRWKNTTTDEWEESTSFFNVTAWGEMGENCAQSLNKGMRVFATGRFDQREYETKEGEKRTSWDLTADEVGPSLRWATAQVEKISRQKAEDGYTPPADYGGEETF